MRLGGVLLILLGVLVTVGAAFVAFGSTFAWNGRTLVEEVKVTPSTKVTKSFDLSGGRRYTVAAALLVDRANLPVNADAGLVVVEGKFPLTLVMKDDAGKVLQETHDPIVVGEPGVVITGHSAAITGDVTVQRMFEPHLASGKEHMTVEVEIGVDPRVHEAKLVLYDDSPPSSVRGAFAVVGAGILLFFFGIGVLAAGLVRSRRKNG